MPIYQIETDKGTFEIESNREPTATEIQQLYRSGQLDGKSLETRDQPSSSEQQQRVPFTPGRLGDFSTPGKAVESLTEFKRIADQSRGMVVGGETPVPKGGVGALVPTSLLGRRRSAEGPQEYVPGSYPLVGETLGVMAGSIAGPAGMATGGALGAAAGKGAEAILQENRLPSTRELAREGALSLIPEVAAGVVPPLARRMVGETPGGQILRRESAAEVSRRLPGSVFQPPPRAEIDRAFALVRASGVKIDTQDIRGALQSLPQGKLDAIRSDIARIDRQNRSGGKLLQLIDGIIGGTGPRVTGADIGDLQDLRSNLRKYAEHIESPDGRDLLNGLREAVDDAVDSGLTRGRTPAGDTPIILRQARESYARYRSAEDLSALIEKNISVTPNGKTLQLNTTSLFNQLRRPAETGLAADVQRSLARTPGAQDRLEKGLEGVGSLMFNIETSGSSDTAGLRRIPVVGFAVRYLADALLSQKGRNVLKLASDAGNPITMRTLALAANAARRSQESDKPVEHTVNLPPLKEFRGIP